MSLSEVCVAFLQAILALVVCSSAWLCVRQAFRLLAARGRCGAGQTLVYVLAGSLAFAGLYATWVAGYVPFGPELVL